MGQRRGGGHKEGRAVQRGEWASRANAPSFPSPTLRPPSLVCACHRAALEASQVPLPSLLFNGRVVELIEVHPRALSSPPPQPPPSPPATCCPLSVAFPPTVSRTTFPSSPACLVLPPLPGAVSDAFPITVIGACVIPSTSLPSPPSPQICSPLPAAPRPRHAYRARPAPPYCAALRWPPHCPRARLSLRPCRSLGRPSQRDVPRFRRHRASGPRGSALLSAPSPPPSRIARIWPITTQ